MWGLILQEHLGGKRDTRGWAVRGEGGVLRNITKHLKALQEEKREQPDGVWMEKRMWVR